MARLPHLFAEINVGNRDDKEAEADSDKNEVVHGAAVFELARQHTTRGGLCLIKTGPGTIKKALKPGAAAGHGSANQRIFMPRA
jgi:hypothetical protein